MIVRRELECCKRSAALIERHRGKTLVAPNAESGATILFARLAGDSRRDNFEN